MNPLVPNQPITPAPTTTSPQGVQAVAPVSAPTPSQLPSAPTPGPLPTPLTNPTLQDQGASNQTIFDYYQIPRQVGQQVAAESAQSKIAGQQHSADVAQAGIKEENLKRQLDPSQYTVTKDPGSQYGLSIVSPMGQKVDFGTYINLTGQDPSKVLSQSADPKAQQFIQAYNNYQTFMQAMLAPPGDQEAQVVKGDFFANNKGLENLNPQQVSNAFMQQYGEFLGMPSTPQQGQALPGITPTFAGQNNPITQSPYYQLQNYPQLNQANPITSQLLNNPSQPNNLSGQLQSYLQANG